MMSLQDGSDEMAQAADSEVLLPRRRSLNVYYVFYTSTWPGLPPY